MDYRKLRPLIHEIAKTDVMKADGEIGIKEDGDIKLFLDKAFYHGELLQEVMTFIMNCDIGFRECSFNHEEFNIIIEYNDTQEGFEEEYLKDLIRIFKSW